MNRNIKVKRIFIENYVGKSTEQPELMKLIHFIESEESKIDSFLFTTWDRISRNTSVLIDFQTECEKWNIIPCAIQQPFTWDSTPSTEFNREIITMVKRKKK